MRVRPERPDRHPRHADRPDRAPGDAARLRAARGPRTRPLGGADRGGSAARAERRRHGADARGARVRRAAGGRRGRPGRDVRRALHDGDRGAVRRPADERGLAGGGGAARGLARAPRDGDGLMPLFGDKRDRGGARSAAEREAARLERERRRAAREGREPPAAPVDDGTGDAPADEQPPLEWDGADPDERDGGEAPYDVEDAPREPEFRDAPAWDDEALRGEDLRGRDVAPERARDGEPQPAAARPEPGGDAVLDPRAQAWQHRRPAAGEEPGVWRDEEPDAPDAWHDDEPAAREDDEPDAPAVGREDEPEARAARRGDVADESDAWPEDEPEARAARRGDVADEPDAWREDELEARTGRRSDAADAGEPDGWAAGRADGDTDARPNGRADEIAAVRPDESPGPGREPAGAPRPGAAAS